MTRDKKDFFGEKRADRLLNRIISHRKKYSESIKDTKVFVRPSVPRGGVVEFKILRNDLDQNRENNKDDVRNLLNATN